MEKAAELQKLIKENNNDYMEFLKDLNRWEDSVKKEDEHLQNSKRLDEKLPPVRKKINPEDKAKKKLENKIEKSETQKPARISSYDYNAWSRFDVDAACADISASSESDAEDEEDDEEVEEERLKIEEQRKVQQASMEKEKGNQLFKEGKYEAAINRYTNAISLHPTDPIFYANRGMALLKTEKYAAAERDCDLALQYDPKYTKALARRATARKKLKRYKEAMQDYKKLLEIEPKNKQAITEIEELEKIIVKATNESKIEDNKSGETKVTLLTNGKDQQIRAKKKRSNKPMKRIFIEEIGEENDTKKNNLQTSKNDSNDVLKSSLPIVSNVKLSVPTTSFMLDSDFKRLKDDEETLHKYIKAIPTKRYSSLFTSIDVLLSPMIKLLNNCFKRDSRPVFEELKSLSEVKRFDMACMFLSRDDKKGLHDVFSYMQSPSYPEKIEDAEVTKLKKKYGVT